MLAKLTSKNQITIPKKIMDQLPDVQHFDIFIDNGKVILKPMVIYESDLEQIRSKIKKLGLSTDTVSEAINWVRNKEIV
jgi:bifunctional DNA-binding transcriptional regulator/antitoxin component of YhaV-PrlF toxin-antitoxin module